MHEERTPRRAVQYLRMSTEHQRYSLENQAAVIAAYALERGFEIVRTYSDAGKSGLTLRGRAALQQLLADALAPTSDFVAILVLDVSRWGRFQDADQSAHYEFICREAGVQVAYCAEPFENDGGMASTIVKHLKRVMAGEYSRELSRKVMRAQQQQARLGFRQGGCRPYGFRRLLVSANGKVKGLIPDGEWKAMHSDRVVYAIGPPEEVAVIVRMFRLYVQGGKSAAQIARTFNAEGLPARQGRTWSGPQVTDLLQNELCIGNYVFNKLTRSMRRRVVRNPESEWIRTSVLAPIVSERIFRQAQRRMAAGINSPKYTDAQLLSALKKLLRREGHLTEQLIETAPCVPSIDTYRSRFGTLRKAYDRLGYDPPSGRWCPALKCFWTYVVILERIRLIHERHGYVSAALIGSDPTLPAAAGVVRHFGSLRRCYELAGLTENLEQARRIGNVLGQQRRFARERAELRGKVDRPRAD